MNFNSPEIQTLKSNLDGSINSAVQHQPNTYAAIKVQALLDITVYVMACRFLEATVKHVVYNCICLLYTSPSPRDATLSRMPSSA